jgi:hypothetical protein
MQTPLSLIYKQVLGSARTSVITLQERKHDLLHEYYVLEPKHWFVADFFSITWPHKP